MSSSFDRKKFVSFIIENRVVGFFEKPVTLKSGRQSNWYVNWRAVSSDVFLLDRLSDFLIAFAFDLGISPDSFYGVPEGATKLAVISTYKFARASKEFAAGSHALPMGRGKPKEHGVPADKFFLGEPKGSVIVVEDVTTTGSSLLTTLDQLKQTDVKVAAAVGLTNRMEKRDDGRSVEEAIAERGVRYHSLSDATEFLPEACRVLKPKNEIIKAIEKEFSEYGVKALKLSY